MGVSGQGLKREWKSGLRCGSSPFLVNEHKKRTQEGADGDGGQAGEAGRVDRAMGGHRHAYYICIRTCGLSFFSCERGRPRRRASSYAWPRSISACVERGGQSPLSCLTQQFRQAAAPVQFVLRLFHLSKTHIHTHRHMHTHMHKTHTTPQEARTQEARTQEARMHAHTP